MTGEDMPEKGTTAYWELAARSASRGLEFERNRISDLRRLFMILLAVVEEDEHIAPAVRKRYLTEAWDLAGEAIVHRQHDLWCRQQSDDKLHGPT